MGRLRRSLYVGRITEYLSLVAVFTGAILTNQREQDKKECSKLDFQVSTRLKLPTMPPRSYYC